MKKTEDELFVVFKRAFTLFTCSFLVYFDEPYEQKKKISDLCQERKAKSVTFSVDK